MSGRMSDERFEVDLRSFLKAQSQELIGAPSLDEMTARIASRVATPPAVRPATRLLWAVAILAMLAAAAIGVSLFGGQRDQKVLVLPPNSPAPSQLGGVGPCANGGVALGPSDGAALPDEFRSVKGLAGGVVALVRRTSKPYGIWVAGPGASGVHQVATLLGPPDPDRFHTVVSSLVEVRSWSDDGTELLVETSHSSQSLDENCSNLWLVNADGTSVTRLTSDGPGLLADLGELAPDGRSVAYVHVSNAQGALRIVGSTGTTRVLDPTPCNLGGPAGFLHELVWAPDGRHLALSCEHIVTVYSIADGTSTTYHLPADPFVAGLSWSPDSGRVLAATVAQGSILGGLAVVSLDPASGSATAVSRSSLNVTWSAWEAPWANFSPDGQWLVEPGGLPGYAPPLDQEALYLVNVATGSARQLVPPGTWPTPASWTADSKAVLFDGVDSSVESLIQLDITDSGQTIVDRILEDTYWFWHSIGP